MRVNIFLIETTQHTRLAVQLDCESKTNLQLARGYNMWAHNWKRVQVFITSEEKPKEGEWELTTYTGGVAKVRRHKKGCGDCPRVIMTDSRELVVDGVQQVPEAFLSWLVKNPTARYIGVIPDYNWKMLIPVNPIQHNKDMADSITTHGQEPIKNIKAVSENIFEKRIGEATHVPLDFPRRNQMDKLTALEKSILNVMATIEQLPADERLTKAVTSLQEAFEAVADFVDDKNK